MDRRRPLHWFALPLLLALGAAQAETPDTTCKARYASPMVQASMHDVAAVTASTLDALDLDLVIAARGGQDLSRWGLRHSHLAFLLREDDGNWRVIHLLNYCASDTSALYREGLANFIGESGSRADLRVGIPTPALRARLRTLLTTDDAAARALHEPRYSAVAYPFRTEYQNSNQWILEVLALAIAAESGTEIKDRTQAQEWLRANDYRPSVLHLGLGKRLGARLFVANATTVDHPASERISGNYSVVTVESVFDFLYARRQFEREMPISHVPLPAPDAPAPAPAP